MEKEELALKLNGVEYRNELSDDLHHAAKECGLIVIYGGSDDLLYLGGVGNDEIGCYNGGDLVICKDGDAEMVEYLIDLEGEDNERLLKLDQSKSAGNIVEAQWCEVDGYSWTYKTKLPHARFDVIEDGDKYCRGIVIDIKDLK